MLSTSGVMSLTFVWDSNRGSGCFTLTTAARPSRTSLPVMAASFSLMRLLFFAYWLIARVSDQRKPLLCVPPSGFGTAFV